MELVSKKEYIMDRSIKVVQLSGFKAWGLDMEFHHSFCVYETQGKTYQAMGIDDTMGGALRDLMRVIMKDRGYDIDDVFEPIVSAVVEAVLDSSVTGNLSFLDPFHDDE